MTSYPVIIESVRKVIRMPDELLDIMDPYCLPMYSGRNDFIVTAVREYIYDTVWMMDSVAKDNSDQDEKQSMSEISSVWESKVRKLIDAVDGMDCDVAHSSSFLVTFPSGTVDMMQFIIDRIPSLRNMTVFCRVAVLYRTGILQEQTALFSHLKDSLPLMKERKSRHIDENTRRRGYAYLDSDPLGPTQ